LNLPPECLQRLEDLEQATVRLAGVNRVHREEFGRALQARARAVEALALWIAGEPRASRPISTELTVRMTKDLERGADILVRLSLDREAARLGLAEVARGLQMLRGLQPCAPAKPNIIDCQG